VQGTRPATQQDPAAGGEGTDQAGRPRPIRRFETVPVHTDRDLPVSVIRVQRTSARETTRDPRVRWFLALDDSIPLAQGPARAGLRFSEEQVFRCVKHDVRWTAARGRTPAPFLLWRWIGALAFILLDLARPLGLHALLPWEATGRCIIPRQVRRVRPTMVSRVGTPVHPCHPRGNAPGRAKGFHPKPVPRHLVLRQTRTKEKKRITVTSTCVSPACAFHLTRLSWF
jgi:hypothetical protein